MSVSLSSSLTGGRVAILGADGAERVEFDNPATP